MCTYQILEAYMNNIIKKYWIHFIIGFVIFFILLFPLLTNRLMFLKSPKIFAPHGISNDAIWIGFFATFFGAIIGGGISGLFTYLGVKKTLLIQEETELKSFKDKHRTIIEVSELIDGGYLLKNHKVKNGRLILTQQYNYILENRLSDGHFNYIHLKNGGPGKAMNCKVKATIRYEDTNEYYTIEVFIPVVYENENIYIPFDRIFDDNGGQLEGNNQYRLTEVLLTYNTFAKEEIKIERISKEIEGKFQSTDSYSIKDTNDIEFSYLFNVKGTDDTWFYLKDFE